MDRRLFCGLLCAIVAPVAAGPAPAEESAGIIVTGSGVVRVRPSVVEISAEVAGKAELAGDAMVKYKDAKRRAIKAIEDLKVAHLTLIEEGLTVGAPGDANAMRMAMMGQGGGDVKTQVEVAERLRIRVSGIDALDAAALTELLAKVMDAAKDAGLQVGAGGPKSFMEMQMESGKPSSLATFVVPDAAEATKKASALAVEDARARAQQLAELAKVRLGPVRSIREMPAAGEGQSMVEMFYGRLAKRDKEGPDEPQIVSATWREVSVGVTLQVQFEIAK